MFTPPQSILAVRQRGAWASVGDSIAASNFGGVVAWPQQLPTLSNTLADVLALTNLAIPSQAVGIANGAIPAMVDAAQLALCDACYNAGKNYNIASITSGLNDGALGRTEAQCYADLTTWRNGRNALGFKTIYVKPVRLDGGAFFGSPAGQTWRTNLITLADANLRDEIDFVFSPYNRARAVLTLFDVVIDVSTIPGTPGDGINYGTDHIHLTTAQEL